MRDQPAMSSAHRCLFQFLSMRPMVRDSGRAGKVRNHPQSLGTVKGVAAHAEQAGGQVEYALRGVRMKCRTSPAQLQPDADTPAARGWPGGLTGD